MSEIKPCPYCGFADTIVDHTGDEVNVACLSCGAAGRYTETADEAIAHWNRVAAADERADAAINHADRLAAVLREARPLIHALTMSEALDDGETLRALDAALAAYAAAKEPQP